MRSPNLFALQLEIAWEDKSANFRKVEALLEEAKPAAGSLVVLPEMFACGFSMNLAVTRQNAACEDETFLAGLARKHGVFVSGGVVSPGTGEMGRNQAVVFSPEGKLLARYTKIHPFSLDESQGHEPGTDIVHFQWGGFTVTPFVCYDLRFPEIFRSAARQQGTGVFVVMALWPVKRQQHWLTLLQARAIENQAYVVGVNAVGTDPNYTYAGRSVVVDPHGVIVADASGRETVLTATLEPEVVTSWRRDFPALRDAHWPIAQ